MVVTDATWLGITPDFGTASNWVENIVPTGTAFFGPSTVTEIHFAGNTVGGFTLNANAENYRFYVSNFLVFDGAGMAINGGTAQIDTPTSGLLRFTNASSAASATMANDGNTEFLNDSTAGSAQITNTEVLQFSDSASAGSAILGNHSLVYFNNASSAGDATITNNAGGNINFFDTSTADTSDITNASNLNFGEDASAGSADITNNSGGALTFSSGTTAGTADISNNGTGTVSFSGSAGSATITQNGGGFNFFSGSTAADATITTKDGAHIDFYAGSSGGDAELIAELGSFFRFSAEGGSLGAGSIAGAGDIVLEETAFTVGSNDLSTELSGGILQVPGGDTSSLVKTGSGTLTLSSVDNDYTGGTTINEGTLQVDGTILGTTTVNDGGTLGGGGTTGAVNVAAGGTVGPGASAGILSTDTIAFAAGSHFAVELGGDTAGSGYDQLAVTGTVDLGGAALDLSSLGAFNPNTAATTDFTIVDNDGTGDDVTGAFDGLAEGDEFVFDGRLYTITYEGGDGNDVVLTSHGASITGTNAGETIDGSTAPAGEKMATDLRDVIDGRNGNDTLRGGDGDDDLIGGRGKDKLYGGADDDTFIFTHKKDSKKGGQRDKLLDFNRSDDIIDLSQIDAKKGGGNQKFKFIGKHDFNDKKGELHYVKKGHAVVVEGDITGNGKADFEIYVKVGGLNAGDFDL